MVIHSQSRKLPSDKNTRLKLAATAKNPTSRIKLFLATWNGATSAILPATTAEMKLAAPTNSPTARLPLLLRMAANVEKTSGLPFPKAKNVTPVKLSLMPRRFAIVLRLMQRKSEAAMPIVLKRRLTQITRMRKAKGWALGRLQ
jgi:hypothetical protein